jgi:hypothetical protein
MDNLVFTMTRCTCSDDPEWPCTLWKFNEFNPEPYSMVDGFTIPRSQVPNAAKTGRLIGTVEKSPEGESWEILPTGGVDGIARDPCPVWVEEIKRVYTLGYRWARFVADPVPPPEGTATA